MTGRRAGRNGRQNQIEREATAARQAARLAVVTGYLAARVPGLDEQAAAALLDEVGSGHPRSVLQIAEHLGQHPDPLATHRQDLPAALRRVAFRLHADGHGFVVAPACSRCGKISAHLPFPNPDGGGNTCPGCHPSPRGTCAECGKDKPLRSRSEQGMSICGACYQRLYRRGECGRCGHNGPIIGRAADGAALCVRCTPKKLHECHRCHQLRPATAHTADGPVCMGCYRAPARPCGRCGRVLPVKKRADADGPDLCSGCYRAPIATCSRCGRTAPCRYATTDTPLCMICVPIGTDVCHRCGKDREVSARWPIGAVCKFCYTYIRSHPQPCPKCSVRRPLIGLDSVGRRICGPCDGLEVIYECRRCGIASTLNRGRCTACHLADHLDELVAAVTGKPNHEQVRALAQALASADRPGRGAVLAALQPLGEGVQPTARLRAATDARRPGRDVAGQTRPLHPRDPRGRRRSADPR